MNKSRAFIFICLILSTQAYAQVAGSYFAVIVSDMNASAAWYSEVFGLKEQSRLQQEGRFDIVNLAGEGIAVELLDLESATSRPEGYITGPFKVGLLVADLEEFVRGLPDGIERPEIVDDERNSLRMIQLRDPDNNIVQVMQKYLGSE